jgi:hypothetical protein
MGETSEREDARAHAGGQGETGDPTGKIVAAAPLERTPGGDGGM